MKSLDEELDRFFFILHGCIGEEGPIGLGNLKWKELTDAWKDDKNTGTENRFYAGKTGTFKSYIEQLAAAGHGSVNKMFGAPKATIAGNAMSSDGAIDRVVLNKIDKLNFFTSTDKGFRFTGSHSSGSGTTPYRMELKDVTMTISVFPNLQRVANTEWAVVDAAIKAGGDFKQLTKINGQTGFGGSPPTSNGGHRTIRPMFLPLIQSFINVRLKHLLGQFK